MGEIVERYVGAMTASGHEIRVDQDPGGLVLWYPLRGMRDGVYARHHMGIARVRKQADVYVVGWLRGTEERACESRLYWDLGKVFASLDEVIASR